MPNNPVTLRVTFFLPGVELSTLLSVYNSRSDLQSLFPEAAGGNYVNLVNWASCNVNRCFSDGDYSVLATYGYWYTLMSVYNGRSDLQGLFPNAYSSSTSYVSLVSWAGGVVTQAWVDGSYSTLRSYGYWYDLMMVYNHRSDLQSLFPNAYGNQNSYVGLVSWAGGVVTQQWVDGDYALLNQYGYWYDLMMVYNQRSDLQSAYPGAYTNYASYVNLLHWAKGVVDRSWSDGSYTTLLPFKSTYDTLG